jgi:hypothetical protein
MKRLLFVALLAVVLPAAAHAKGPLQVCGASGCALLGAEAQPPVRVLGVEASTPAVSGIAPAPYFVVRFADLPGTLAYWIPSASVLRLVPQSGHGVWVATRPSEDALLREKTAELRPYPKPKRADVYVDYHFAKRANGYFRLFTIGTPVAPPPPTAGWREVWLRGGRSPWNDFSVLFWISNQGNLLKRDGAVLEISPDVARRIRAGLPLS